MNQQIPGQHQANFQNQSPQQPQGGGQPRQATNGPPKATQGQQQTQARYEPPKLAFFILEKPRTIEGWDDVEPERQHYSVQEIENELAKFRRKQISVKRALDEISSPSCRRRINNLVKDETEALWKSNKSMQYAISGIPTVKSRWLDDRKQRQETKLVQVILELEPSGFPDTQSMKPTANTAGGAANAQGGQDLNKGMKPPGAGGQGPIMQQQQRNGPQQGNNMGQSQQFEPRPGPQGGVNAPPPPPPPPGGGNHGPPPPPPPPGGHPGGHPPPPSMHHQHGNVMPGAFPSSMPIHGMRPGQPPIQVIDPRYMHSGKSKTKGRGDESSSESDDWESESGSSGSEPIRVRNVERGDYGLINKKQGRGRGKHSKSSKKSHRHRSQSQGLSRSRSHSRAPHHSSRRRRDSDLIDPRGRHSPSSSGASSPKLPPIHIHMPGGNTSSGDERGHGHRKSHSRRDSHHDLPTSSYNKRKSEKKATSHPMARGGSRDSKDSEKSWSRASESSFATSSSVKTGEDSYIDASRRPRGHRHISSYSRVHRDSFSPPRPSAYADFDDLNRRDHARDIRIDDLNRRDHVRADLNRRDHIRDIRIDDLNRRDRLRDIHADDYPYSTSPPGGRDAYYKEPILSSRPLPPRRANTTQAHPFTPLPHLHQDSYRYDADLQYAQPRQLRYTPDHSPDRSKMDELAGALLDHIKKDNQRVPLRRRHTTRGGPGVVNEDEWDVDPRFQSARGRAYGGGFGY